MDVNDIQTMFAYNRWANQRMVAALEKLSEEQLMATRVSSFPSIWESAFHIVAAEWIWLKRWQGLSPRASVANPDVSAGVWDGLTPSDAPRAAQLKELPLLRNFASEIERERQKFLNGLTDATLQESFHYTDMTGGPRSEPLVNLMLHLFNHGTHHRGQVNTLLRQAGCQAVALDMILFFREPQANVASR
ncbi:MAG: DinB family protein [Candidatus Korobacteraceae bacterium]